MDQNSGQLPQFTGFTNYLRIYGAVGRPPNEFDECDDNTFYRMCRHRMLQQMQRNILPLWSEVREALKDNCKVRSISDRELNELLRKMLDIGRDFIGFGSPMDLVESSVVYVLQVFHDCYYVRQLLGVTSQQMTELEDMFGAEAINNSLVNTAYEYSKVVFDLLDIADRQRLFMPFNNGDHHNSHNPCERFVSSIETEDEEEWGKEFKDMDIDPFNEHLDIFVTWESIMDSNHKEFNADMKASAITSSFQYNDTKYSNNHVKSQNSSQSSSLYNIEWLNVELTKFIDKYNDEHEEPYYMSIESLVDTVISWIQMKGKTDEEISVELYDLLGNSCIDIIEKIVKYRKDFKNSYRDIYGQESVLDNDNKREKSKFQSSNAFREKRPAISQSVIVQTEEEKNLKKQLRKIEKKMNKGFSKDFDSTNNSSLSLEDIERMKNERSAALLRAMYAPLFSDGSQQTIDQTEYPFVFDAYAEAKNTPAFVSGAKMTLPSGFVRNDQRRWEEITIAAPPPPPAHIIETYKLIDVQEELDEFGKIAFNGIKCLNQIQSIVFNTAYTKSENMLICAPTGAGKTNVAMLAILHQIKTYSSDVKNIDLDKFKIVYIAPMKALAAEMTDNFGKKLSPLGIKVRELTGDMQLTKSEIMSTQILVTTPEKWDVVTRKSKGDVQLLQLVRLIIIDEVHLLQSDRGPVLEALVARTKRYVESSQMTIRLIGLSATLPNYKDVAEFLGVNPRGLFVFDNRFRPVPLSQTFVGCKATQTMQQMYDMDEVTYEKVFEMVSKGHQVMVFVHARNATLRTANLLRDRANKSGDSGVFTCDHSKLIGSEQMMRRVRQKQLSELFERGFAIHHAGMLRQDRNLVEKLFRCGVIKVLVCTATLAWGVNLPAHSVIIRGTEMYDSSHGNYVDISMLDVMQIFGRAGRPQYDKEGHGTIITAHNKLRQYLSLLTCQYPIESNFKKYMTDNMNAEIASGTITTIDEAIDWLGYTYLFIRMRKNPIGYGISGDEYNEDPSLFEVRRKLVIESAVALDGAKMIRYNPEVCTLDTTDLGRTASHFYIKYISIQKFNELIHDSMSDMEVLAMIAHAQEFEQLKSREDEFDELDDLLKQYCRITVKGGVENCHGKVNILMQSYLSRAKIDSFSLVSDSMFIMQNVNRIVRGLFEYILKKGWSILARSLIKLAQMFENQQWDFESPLRQFAYRDISYEVMNKIEKLKLDLPKIRDMPADELGRFVRHQSYGAVIKRCANTLPNIEVEACIKPITRTILMVQLELTPNFKWDDKYHGKVCEIFWVWLSDIDSNHIYHSEMFKFTKRQVIAREMQKMTFNIPLLDADKIPSQYIVRFSFDRWIGCDLEVGIPCHNMILPQSYIPYTKLLDLDPLPVSALNNPLYESIYNKFTHFNPIQTQLFHTLYHTDRNVLLGAPTGSGKTIAAEIAMFRVFNQDTKTKVVYIAPLKALVRERVDDWREKLEKNIGRRIVELTGDVTPDIKAINEADVIVTTPEKWDGVSRSWKTRAYVRDVGLIIIDEIHLLGEDRGPVLEVIVSRTNFICANSEQKLRIIGLSTAIANAEDLANWLNIKQIGLYNFKPSVRPVPLEVHVHGYPGKNYCPRMALMNKPTYRAILQHSPKKPVLVFVSSRRQTRLTALDLIAFLASDTTSDKFLHMDEMEMRSLIENVRDSNLKLTLAFGIGLHHAGLHEKDRSLVEELFLNHKIQVLITTATLAWGVNLPAHAVIIKGTEYFDGKLHRYVDFPITDVLQMMGRAGRPQYDHSGVAVILVHDIKKEFYKKFLYEPFPVESSLLNVLPDHLNAEIVAGTIKNKQEALEYLNWTYLLRRVLKNPFYYGLNSNEPNEVNLFLSSFIDKTLQVLVDDCCIVIEDDDRTIKATFLGRIASYYYLSHSTIRMFYKTLSSNALDFANILEILTNAHEYNELPVRHNEDNLNGELANKCPIKVSRLCLDSPHTKANLLLQAHMSRLALPVVDYLTDLKTVMDQAIRVMQSMIDVSAQTGLLATTLRIITLQQSIIQARWHYNSPLLALSHIDEYKLSSIPVEYSSSLPKLISLALKGYETLASVLRFAISDELAIQQTYDTLLKLPFIEISLSICIASEFENNNRSVSMDLSQKPLTQRIWIDVQPNTEYAIVCSFLRRGGRKDSSRAIAPKFPKIKDEGWLLVLGDVEKSELIALRRVGFIGSKARHTNHNLMFTTPSTTGRVIYTFYFVSDSYLGLDQQYDIFLNVKGS